MIAWLQQHQVTLAVREASGGYQRGWAAALRAAGIAVRGVDPKRVRCFAKSADTHIGKLDAAAEATITASPPLAARARIIAGVPGLGRRFVAGALAWLPELGQISNKPLAALVGVAPYDDDGGQHAGERRIKGGRQELRNRLFMATLGAATQHNPVLCAYDRKLRAKGKKAKLALVACRRKTILILDTMPARNQTWNPSGLPSDNAGSAAAPA